FIPEMKGIIGTHLIGEAPFEEDAQRATDLIVLKLDAIRVACRIRSSAYLRRYGGEFTLRSSRPNGVETELSKILAGWGDYLLYGFAAEAGPSLAAWLLGDLHEFRRWHNRALYRMARGEAPGIHKQNADRTCLRAYRVAELPSGFVVARKTTSENGVRPTPC
ncbi:MAG: hypothetical protein ACRD2Z_10815, partial [Thermoanaerobaculia bacterium]